MALRKPTKRPTPSNWASWKPFGIGEQRPNNYKEVFRAVWENRDNAGYAWRILSDGVCDGCALGTKGLHDWTIEGVHLCNVRLRLLRLNTMGPLDSAELADVEALRKLRGDSCGASAGCPSRWCAATASRASRRSAGTRRWRWSPSGSAPRPRTGSASS